MPSKFEDITTAFEFANTNGDMGELRAFVCRQTGKIYYQFEDVDLQDLEDDKLPDDIEDATKYVPIPDKRDLDLGKPLVPAFVREFLPDDLDDVRHFFSKRGAYPKFRSLLARRRAIDCWHAFENEATEQALRAWCKEQRIEIED